MFMDGGHTSNIAVMKKRQSTAHDGAARWRFVMCGHRANKFTIRKKLLNCIYSLLFKCINRRYSIFCKWLVIGVGILNPWAHWILS